MKKTVTAGGVVMNRDGKILVVSQHGDSWSLPKGHVEKGEKLLTAAIREIGEESGITDLIYIKKLQSYRRYRIGRGGLNEDQKELKTLHWFLFHTPEVRLAPKDPSNPEARWVNIEEVPKLLTHAKDKEFFKKIIVELK